MKDMKKSDEAAPKNPFAGMLGGGPDDDNDMGMEPDSDEDDYAVTPEEVSAASEVRAAIKSGSDEDLAKAICMLVKLHGGG